MSSIAPRLNEERLSVDNIVHLGSFLHPFQLAKSSLVSKKWNRILGQDSFWEKIATALGINAVGQKNPLQFEVGRLYQTLQMNRWVQKSFPAGCSCALQKGELLFLNYDAVISVYSLRTGTKVEGMSIQHVTQEHTTIRLVDKFLIKAWKKESTVTCEVFSTEATQKSLFVFTQTAFDRRLLSRFFIVIQHHLLHRESTGVCVRNLSGEKLDYFHHASPVIFMYPHGDSLITVDSQAILRIWDIKNKCCTGQINLELGHAELSDHIRMSPEKGIYRGENIKNLFPLEAIHIAKDKIYLFFGGELPKYCAVFNLNGSFASCFLPDIDSFPMGGQEYAIAWSSSNYNGYMKNRDLYKIGRTPDGKGYLSFLDPSQISKARLQPALRFEDIKDYKFLDRMLILWDEQVDGVRIQDLRTGKNITKFRFQADKPQTYVTLEGRLIPVTSKMESTSMNPQLPLTIIFPELPEYSQRIV